MDSWLKKYPILYATNEQNKTPNVQSIAKNAIKAPTIDKNIRIHPIYLLVVIIQLFVHHNYIKNKIKKEILVVKKKQKNAVPN